MQKDFQNQLHNTTFQKKRETTLIIKMGAQHSEHAKHAVCR